MLFILSINSNPKVQVVLCSVHTTFFPFRQGVWDFLQQQYCDSCCQKSDTWWIPLWVNAFAANLICLNCHWVIMDRSRDASVNRVLYEWAFLENGQMAGNWDRSSLVSCRGRIHICVCNKSTSHKCTNGSNWVYGDRTHPDYCKEQVAFMAWRHNIWIHHYRVSVIKVSC